MKKVVSVILVVIISLCCLVGCGSTGSSTEETATTTTKSGLEQVREGVKEIKSEVNDVKEEVKDTIESSPIGEIKDTVDDAKDIVDDVKEIKDTITGDVRTPLKAKDCEDKDYEDVKRQFEEAGFTNITLEKDEDLKIAVLHDDGDVESVTVDGDKKFDKGDKYSPDAEVVITYHTYPE